MEAPDPEADIPTAAPAKPPEAAAKEWKMPEPVFRRSSGYLPQGYVKRFPVGTANGPQVSPPPPVDPFMQTFVGTAGMSARDFASDPPAAAAAAIEPQPDVAEVALPEDEPAEPPPAKKERSRTAKFVIAAFLIIAAGVFIVVFLAVVYVLFLAPSGDLPTLE